MGALQSAKRRGANFKILKGVKGPVPAAADNKDALPVSTASLDQAGDDAAEGVDQAKKAGKKGAEQAKGQVNKGLDKAGSYSVPISFCQST